jgi:hypothetical protein
MEDLFTTMQRLENLKNLGQKRQKKKSAPKKSGLIADDKMIGTSLIDAMGGLDFGSRYGDSQSFYDVDSALAARTSESVIDSVFEKSFLDDDGIGLD